MIEFIFPLLLSNLVDYSIRHDFPAQIKCSFVNNSMNSKSIKDLNKVMLEVCQTDITFNVSSFGYNMLSAGGALFMTESESYILDCIFNNNKAYCELDGTLSYAMGGSIYFEYSHGRIENSIFDNCSVFSVANSDSSTNSNANSCSMHIIICEYDIINCSFSNNYCFLSGEECASLGGSCIFQQSSGGFINCNFYNNTSNASTYSSQCSGGAIFFHTSNGYINDCIFIGNSVNSYGTDPKSVGGAIYINKANISFSNCIFDSNYAYRDYKNAGGYGGAIRLISSNATFLKSNFCNNQLTNPSIATISGCGGGLSFSTTNGTVIDCMFQNNCAVYGGDVYVDYESDTVALIIQETKFYHIQNLVESTLIYFDPTIDTSVINHFIQNQVVIKNYNGIKIFGNWHSTSIKIFWNFKDNCCFPYYEEIFFSGTSSFYPPEGSKKTTFNDAFQDECALIQPTQTNSMKPFSQLLIFSKLKNIYSLKLFFKFS